MKYLTGILAVGAVLGAVAFFGYSPFINVVESFGASSAGTTFNTAKFAAVSVALATPGANATSSSVQNTDANDRYITSIKVGCQGVGTSKTAYTGAGLAALTLSVSTTSTAAPAVVGTNLVGGVALTIATSTTQFVVASSTGVMPGNTAITDVWKAGSYLTFQTNATNTAACVFGVDYMAS